MRPARSETFWAQTWRRFRRHRVAFASGIFLAILCGTCIATPLIVSAKTSVELHFDRKLEPPSTAHPFGTNQLGQDYLVRSLYGGRVSIRVGLEAMLIALVIGTLLGSIAGYRGGWADSLIMRAVDVVLAIPIFFVLLLLASYASRSQSTWAGSLTIVALIIGLTSWTEICRLVRAAFLSLREKEFVEAARALGCPAWLLVARHLLPNAASSIIIAATLGIAQAIITESALSYLGFGVQPPQVSWGSMLRMAQPNLRDQPWLAFFPGLLIFLTVLAFNFLGDGLRDAMDPRTGKR